MRSQNTTGSFTQQWLRPLLIGVAVGIVCCMLLLLAMAAVVKAVDVPRAATLPMAVAAAAIAAFAAGLTAALIARRHGLIIGAASGALLFLVILIAGFIRYTGVDGGYALLKAAVLIVMGGLGGVLGVNRRRR